MTREQHRQYAVDLIGCMGAWSIDTNDARAIVREMRSIILDHLQAQTPLPNPLAGIGAHAISPHVQQ